MTENSKMFNLWRLLFSGVIAAGFSYQLLWSLYFHQASKSWQAVEARVVSIENEPKSSELRYTYEFRGEEFRGNTLSHLCDGTLFEKDSINNLYHVGDLIQIYLNPANPHQSVVERRDIQFKYLWKQILIIGFTGTLTAYSGLKFRRLVVMTSDEIKHSGREFGP